MSDFEKDDDKVIKDLGEVGDTGIHVQIRQYLKGAVKVAFVSARGRTLRRIPVDHVVDVGRFLVKHKADFETDGSEPDEEA